MSRPEEHHGLDAEISLAAIEGKNASSNSDKDGSSDKRENSSLSSPSRDGSVDPSKQPQGSPVESGKNYNEFFAGKKDDPEVQAFDDEMKSIDLHHEAQQ